MKRLFVAATILILFLPVFSGCSPNKSYHTIEGVVMGHSYQVVFQIPDYAPWTFKSDIKRAARKCTYAIDRSISPYDKSSVISKINSNTDMKADSIFTTVLMKTKSTAELTGASMNATTGPLRDLWGYNLVNQQKITPMQIAGVLEYTGIWKVSVENGLAVKKDPRIQLNFNNMGIGFAADYLGTIMDMHNISNYMIQVGKVVLCKGVNPSGTPWRWVINQASGNVIYLLDKAISICGNLSDLEFRDGKRFNQMFNSNTGYPVWDPLMSTLVIADNSLDATAFSIAFYSMGFEKSVQFLESYGNIQAILFYYKDNQIMTYKTPNINQRYEIQYFP
ncbi:MAG: Thiamine biosynthesis lipoprotein ApbE precursor [Bacteroidetes bacterium ADurb.Bin139]|nr:MAG: Thiamine biosynthesis lipoprotein ApbE precursor [Bacteroidetes bacterium ADurb.Bin139]HOZ19297.1 FAD:protein FMN transferase [Bacteroidales bacterium]